MLIAEYAETFDHVFAVASEHVLALLIGITELLLFILLFLNQIEWIKIDEFQSNCYLFFGIIPLIYFSEWARAYALLNCVAQELFAFNIFEIELGRKFLLKLHCL